jgi:signal recognition particle protein
MDGYTAAHLAAGYMKLDSLRYLLFAGADAELEDNTGRTVRVSVLLFVILTCSSQVQGLVRALLSNTPMTATMYSRRVALESMLSEIESHIYEEVIPAALLSKRSTIAGTEYLVRWMDGAFSNARNITLIHTIICRV